MENKPINKEDFSKIRKELEDFDFVRDKLIKDSRDLLKLSKEIIYDIHRKEFKNAEANIKLIREMYEQIKKGHKQDDLNQINHFKVIEQEYVEAVALFYIVKERRLIESTELNVEGENYLLGICDLSGELGRLAVNSAIREDFETVNLSRGFIEQIYGEMLKFDFGNSELRRKFDQIKYELKKVEDLMLQLKLRKMI